MDRSNYFPIKENAIKILDQNGCRAENWLNILVSNEFDPNRVRDVIFKGKVRIGSLKGTIKDFEGINREAGIFRATLDNVDVGDNCFISNVHVGLFNLDIEPGVVIENVGLGYRVQAR